MLESPESVSRFYREVQAAAQLFHPNIVMAFDAGEQDGIHYLVMEYVDGLSLSALVRRQGRLPVLSALNYVYQAAKGLEYAHSRHIIHRDVKPSNLIVGRDGVVKVLDMGLARFASMASPEITSTGAVIGTMEYAAPEQTRDPRLADHRSDIYSLGVTLYYLLMGKSMYAGSPISVALAHAQSPAPTLCLERSEVALGVDAIFQRMVAKDPRHRFQSMAELLAALERCGAHAAGTVPPIEMTDSKRLESASTAVPPASISAVAIDLSAATSRIAWIDPDGRPTIVQTSDGVAETRSMLLFRGKQVIAGNAADELRHEFSAQMADDLLTCLGESQFPRLFEGTSYPPSSLLALLLRGIADGARKQIGRFEHVVLTVPSAYDEVRRAALQDAGYMAGLQVMDLINKSTAVATDWWIGQQNTDGTPPDPASRNVLVFRPGVTTFDATVFRIEGPEIRAVAVGGERDLGRRQFENRLADRLVDQFQLEHCMDLRDDPQAAMRVGRLAERIMQTLVGSPRIEVTFYHAGRSMDTLFLAEQVESSCRELIERLVRITCQTIVDAGLSWQQIDQILLVGRLARFFPLSRAMAQAAGPHSGLVFVDDASAVLGGSIHAACLLPHARRFFQHLRVSDITFHSLGVVGSHATSKKQKNAVVIPRNSPLPAMGKRRFRAMPTIGEKLSIPIVCGDDPDPSRCDFIGVCDLDDLPSDIPPGSILDVEFHVRNGGRLSVVVEVAATKERISVEIRRPHPMPHAKLLRWREWVDTTVLCSGTE
jgi:molecular chaperone DnaK (HSP70)